MNMNISHSFSVLSLQHTLLNVGAKLLDLRIATLVMQLEVLLQRLPSAANAHHDVLLQTPEHDRFLSE